MFIIKNSIYVKNTTNFIRDDYLDIFNNQYQYPRSLQVFFSLVCFGNKLTTWKY